MVIMARDATRERSEVKTASSVMRSRIARMNMRCSFWIDGAGDGDRTRDIQLGKLAFYR